LKLGLHPQKIILESSQTLGLRSLDAHSFAKRGNQQRMDVQVLIGTECVYSYGIQNIGVSH
jgi:hypothetical protein